MITFGGPFHPCCDVILVHRSAKSLNQRPLAYRTFEGVPKNVFTNHNCVLEGPILADRGGDVSFCCWKIRYFKTTKFYDNPSTLQSLAHKTIHRSSWGWRSNHRLHNYSLEPMLPSIASQQISERAIRKLLRKKFVAVNFWLPDHSERGFMKY